MNLSILHSQYVLYGLLTAAVCCTPAKTGNKNKNNANSGGVNPTNGLFQGPGRVDANFSSSSNYIKVTPRPIPTSQHGQGQARNAEIWYSNNLQPLFGSQRVANVPVGSVAIKTFTGGDGREMITSMVKRQDRWDYYMGPRSQIPTTPLTSQQASGCFNCHQSQGRNSDMLTYLSRAVGTSPIYGGSNGAPVLPANYRSSNQFVKANRRTIPTTQHAKGQGTNAEVWYSSNLRSYFGRASFTGGVPDGSIAIKEFDTPDGRTITSMVKRNGRWNYYVGPANNYPAHNQLSESEATAKCSNCHQSTGRSTDSLPYLPRVQ